MKVTIEQNAFQKAVNHVQSVVERRNTIPILGNVLISTSGNEIKLVATDLDIMIMETAPALISEAGSTTLPAHLLNDIVRKLPDGAQLELEKDGDDGRFALYSGRSRFALQSLPAEDFPDLEAGEFTHSFSLEATSLKSLIDKTRFAVSTEETRYYLNGIYLHEAENSDGPTLRSVATDGHRLAQVEMPLPDGAAGMPGIIVPRKTVLELHKLLETAEGLVDIGLSDAKIRFVLDGIIIVSKLIDGSFPDYTRVIPQNNTLELDIDSEIFTKAVDRVSTVASDKVRAVKLSLEPGKLILSVNNPESGSATEEIAVSYDGGPMDIGFNSRYLLDITGQMDSGQACFRLADTNAPALIFDRQNPAAIFVLMPMRV
jgi:DNA polymerase-3 subunit beta